MFVAGLKAPCGRSPVRLDRVGHEHPTVAGDRRRRSVRSCIRAGYWRSSGSMCRSAVVLGSQAGCSIDRPAPGGMIVGSTVILVMMETLLVAASPFALKSVPKGGSSALLAASSSLPSVVKAISSTRVVPPVEMVCLIALAVRRIEINHLERAVTVAGIEPAAMGRNAVRPGEVVVDGARVELSYDADKAPDGPFELEGLGVDDINPRI